MGVVDKVKDAGKKIKKAVEGFKKTIDKIKKIGKFLATTVGQIVAILIFVAVCIFLVYVLIKSLEFSILSSILGDDFAGISSDGDYAYLISSLGDAGYDSLITEKTWQDYLAYEYAVLMDVAEYIYEGQQCYSGEESDKYLKRTYGYFMDKDDPGKEPAQPSHMPYLPVHTDYDQSTLTYEDWLKCVLEGQVSARYGIANVSEVPSMDPGYTIYGGNRDVMPPTLTYEYKRNPNDPSGAGSIVPYIIVQKEGLAYHYYTVGDNWDELSYAEDKKTGNKWYTLPKVAEKYKVNLTGHESDIQLMEFNFLLNIGNMYLPKNAMWGKYIADHTELDPLLTKDAWIPADTPLDQNLFFTTDAGSVLYKVPLQVIIDRYMPKAILLTTWFYLKDAEYAEPENTGRNNNEIMPTKESQFKIDELMKSIKRVYNYYCWDGEALGEESIDALTYYPSDGKIIRDDEGKAKTEGKSQTISNSNEKTFLHFGQAGLEANRFKVFVPYEPKTASFKGPRVSSDITGDGFEKTIPVATEVISKSGEFLDRFTLNLDCKYTYTYTYTYEQKITISVSYPAASVGEVDSFTPAAGHTKHMFSGARGLDFDDCKQCIQSHGKYLGWTVLQSGAKWVVQCDFPTKGGTHKFLVTERIEGQPINDTDTMKIELPYEIAPKDNPDFVRGEELYISPDAPLSSEIYEKIVQTAETRLPKDPGFMIETQEHEVLNYNFIYPPATDIKDGVVHAQPSTRHDDFKKKVAFYNFNANGSDPSFAAGGVNKVKDDFNGYIITAAKEDKNVIPPYAREQVEKLAQPPVLNLNIVESNFEINEVSIEDINYKLWPVYTGVYKQKSPNDAIIDVDLYNIVLTLEINQKRVACMLITDAESWAKSSDFDMSLIQNPFVYTNYRYVVPHSYFGFGLRVFEINELPKYRVEYYREFFSKYENSDPAIKEADVLSMLLQWEDAAKEGEESAYQFMRDLYKLVIYTRERDKELASADGGKMLSTAYSYMYIPDTVWDFREGISQEKFWTERLAAELTGDDALTDEEQRIVKTAKDEISWQILDYEEYLECQYESNGENKYKIYGLFPFGSPYTRAIYMEKARKLKKFDDGDYSGGHQGADWYSRKFMKNLIKWVMYDKDTAPLDVQKELDASKEVYNYELRARTLRNILDGPATKSEKVSQAEAWCINEVNKDAYNKAEASILKELAEYKVKSPEVAVAGGVVTAADYNCYSGFHVTVCHADSAVESARTNYVHMRRWPVVQVKDIVGPGTVLGYEGTTGNSSGNHIHMGVVIDGAKKSPSEYLAPIYSPFYDSAKISDTKETLNNMGLTKDIYLLGTDCYSLLRTVVMQGFDGEGNAKYSDGDVVELQDAETAILLRAATFFKSGDQMYLKYGEAIDPDDDEAINFISSGNNVIVREGEGNETKYWECSLEEVYKPESTPTETETEQEDEDEVYDDRYTGIYLVTNRKELKGYTPVSIVGIVIRLTSGTTNKEVRWGINVPVEPLVKDGENAIDISSLTLEKMFNPAEKSSEWKNKPNDPGTGDKDVTATKDFFDPGSNKVRDRLSLPPWMLIYVLDIISPYEVAVYEGPYSIEHQTSGTIALGFPGSASGDVLALKRALMDRGFDPDDELKKEIKTDKAGIYTEALKAALIRANDAIPDGGATLSIGAAGKKLDDVNYSIAGVTHWNAYVRYGGIQTAIKVGKAAATRAALSLGLPPTFVCGVASCESGFLPTNESHEFCSGANTIYAFSGDPYPDQMNGIILYKGVRKVMRRAQGLMQLAPGVGLTRATKKASALGHDGDINYVMNLIRGAGTNAILGAEYLSENILRIEANSTNFSELQKNVNGNPAFAELEKITGIDKITFAECLCSAFMYNKGPGDGNTEHIIGEMAKLTFVGGKVSYSSSGGKGQGYTAKVANYMVDNAGAK